MASTTAAASTTSSSTDNDGDMKVTYILCALNNDALRKAWMTQFSDVHDNVVVAEKGGLFENPATALVSPANCYGYMDGGIDQFFQEKLGYDVEMQLQNKMASLGRHKTEIGDALLLPVQTAQSVPWDYWVSAPTMVTPRVLKKTSRNAYLAFRAVLRSVQEHNQSCSNETTKKPIRSVGVPGLCTGIGAMDPIESARQMREAYDEVILGTQPEKTTSSSNSTRTKRVASTFSNPTTTTKKRRKTP